MKSETEQAAFITAADETGRDIEERDREEGTGFDDPNRSPLRRRRRRRDWSR
jgi:hypothetical protein